MRNPFLLLLTVIFFTLLLTLLPFSNTFVNSEITDWILITPLLLLLGGAAIIYNSLGENTQQILQDDEYIIQALSNTVQLIIFSALVEIGLVGLPILGQIDYKEFGIPFFHVAVYGGLIYLAIIGTSYSISQSKILHSYGVKIILFVLAYAIIILSRHLLMILFIGFFIAYLRSKKLSATRFLALIGFCLLAIWIFGFLGSVRMANILGIKTSEADLYILEAGGASDFYIETGLGAAFFWFWLYLATPMFNLLNTVKIHTPQDSLLTDFINFIVFEVMPQTMSKRIALFFDLNYPDQYLIVEHLNVSTAFAGSYINLGWIGVILYIYWMMVFVFILKYSSKNTSNNFLSSNFTACIMLLSLFDNMLIIPSVFVASIFLIFHGKKIKAI